MDASQIFLSHVLVVAKDQNFIALALSSLPAPLVLSQIIAATTSSIYHGMQASNRSCHAVFKPLLSAMQYIRGQA
jgi:hypothetical protein